MDHFQNLKTLLESHKATIGVIGLGYVGLPLSLRMADIFERVVGFDIDEEKVLTLNNNKSYIKQIDSYRVVTAREAGFEATSNFEKTAHCDVLILCVPTPLTKHREPDLSFVRITLESIMPHLREGQAISLESTTFPGTTEEIVVPRIEKTGLKTGQSAFVIYSPEREDPGNPNFNTQTIPKIVGGHTQQCLEIGKTLYSQVIDKVVPVSSTKAAEMTKLLENIHRAVNIGLVNEMKMVADKMGINIHEVIDAAATKPFGFTKYTPGPGLGGHCIPIDPFYLTWKAKEYGINTRFIELSGEVNRGMPDWVVGKLIEALNSRGKALKGTKILILGIAYKKNVDDTRESPAIKIMEILRSKGAIIEYSDPYVSVFPRMRDHSFNLTSISLSEQTIASYEVAILATDHDCFDYDLIKDSAQLLLDCRNRIPSALTV